MSGLQTLVLNADYRPLSYHPLSLWSWQDALSALLSGRVNLVANYDRKARSPSRVLPIPSVVALKRYVAFDGRAAFTRYNIYLRDDFACQYCGGTFAASDLTFDHVHPRSRGGLTTWDNVVAACAPCNSRKADRTPGQAGMPLIRPPVAPTIRQLDRLAMRRPPASLHHGWIDYLYWDSELER
ncbi:MAG: HNH endonuclease [Alphaproteobacteria bacterium]|nr:HNH endonuclease [Alphaproteobacteria bacterium]MBF0249433.1 HNH endonuclease [Alphaproteobacteria bacterium]